jgi:hypothetical protein
MQSEMESKIDAIKALLSSRIEDNREFIHHYEEIGAEARRRIQMAENEIQQCSDDWDAAIPKIRTIYEQGGTILSMGLWDVLWMDAYGYQHLEQWTPNWDG